MDWIGRLNSAMDYIDENLQGEISYEALARLACCSAYNFQRMFSYIAGMPLAEYIRSRRLTLAAFDLLRADERILDIALKYGYESQDAFSRAFRNFHGALPSAVKSGPASLKSCPKLSFRIQIEGAESMKYQLEQWPAFTVAGIAHPMKTDEAFSLVPGIWERAWQDGTIETFMSFFPDYRPAGFLGLAAGGQWGGAEQMNYILGVTNFVEGAGVSRVPPPEGFTEFSYPAATWVVINADGPLPQAVQEVYHKFYSQWLPSSGFKLADLPVIECYLQEEHQEVWVAVEPNG